MKIFRKSMLGVAAVLAIIILGSCSSKPAEPPIETERKERDKIANGIVASLWKGFKVTTRSMPINTDKDKLKENPLNKEIVNKIGLGPQLQKLYSFLNIENSELIKKQKAPDISASDLMSLASEIYTLQSKLGTVDEDDFPTAEEVFVRLKGQEPSEWMKTHYNSSVEHLFIGIACEFNYTPSSWKTYELSKINPDTIKATDLQMLALLAMSVENMRHGWYYLTEESTSKALKTLDGDKISFSADIKQFLPNVKDMKDDEVFRAYSRGLFHLIRGYARYKMKDSAKEKLAVEDIASSVSNFGKVGVDNEITWLPSVFVNIKNGDLKKADDFLERLSKSKKLGDSEKTSFKKAKELLQKNDSAGALDIIADKTLFAQVAVNYVFTSIFEVDFKKYFEESDEGKLLRLVVPEINSLYTQVSKYIGG